MADFSWFTPLRAFYAHFPIHTYPAVPPPSSFSLERPTLWITRPRGTGSLSADVECLKWQAYLALRGVTDVAVRWDISPDGALGGRFPNLQIPPSSKDDGGKGKLLPAHMIPAWVDEKVGASTDPLEGYKDEASRDEGHAWVALLEGNVHAALSLSQPKPRSLRSLISPEAKTARSLETMLSPPPAPFSGFGSLLPVFGMRVSGAAVEWRYLEAIAALSERLGNDKWFLSSEAPTSLDALVFGYLHTILHAKDDIRIEVSRRANLVTWERRVRAIVATAFQHGTRNRVTA